MTTSKLELVTLDLFNDQVTLGLLGVLENTPGVHNVTVKQFLPCDKAKITAWEQRNACQLPDDVRQFYSSCDGFKLTWSYKIDGILTETSANSGLPIGNITINPLSDLIRLCDVKSDSVDMSVMRDLQMLDRLSGDNTPNFTATKIFELDSSLDVGHICLVYLDENAVTPAIKCKPDLRLHEEPSRATVWLMDTSYCWHFLAPNFSNYFRKALVHMGLPHWQLKFTDLGLTPIGEFFMNLVAPHLNVTEQVPAIGQSNDDGTSTPNHFDSSILKNTLKSNKSKKTPVQSKSAES